MRVSSRCSVALMIAAAVCFALASGQAYADMKDCEPDELCFNQMKDQANDLCGNFGPNSGGMTTSGCGAPPCQANPIEIHQCFFDGCDHKRVLTCQEPPVQACNHTPQECGAVETGACTSTRTCTSKGCPAGQQKCTCKWGVCQGGGPEVPCTPLGCGIQPAP